MSASLFSRRLIFRSRHTVRFRANYATSKEETPFHGIRQSGYTTALYAQREGPEFPIFRMVNQEGVLQPDCKIPAALSRELLMTAYKQMRFMSVLDTIMYDAQRQGRISFYMTNFGEEATLFGSSMALTLEDVIFAQYREVGVFIHRGLTLDEILSQCFATAADPGKGRQMPVHYGSKRLNIQTISSPLATQIPQAAGAAYALKRQKRQAVVACYFGDGAASEGDFHAAMNFAATLECPVLFLVRNNGYAISTSVEEQYRGDGIASRATGYGIRAIRVDGQDLVGVYTAVNHAREMALKHNCPVLIEAMTYRIGHHSTSDDSSLYREQGEIDWWRSHYDAIDRLKKFFIAQGWFDGVDDAELIKNARAQIIAGIREAAKAKKPPVTDLFTDVYADVPVHLKRQEKELHDHLRKYNDKYRNLLSTFDGGFA